MPQLLSDLVPYALLAVFLVCAGLYWTALGVLAHRTGRSAALWVVAGLATLGIGFVATYLLMVSRARRERLPPNLPRWVTYRSVV